MIKNAIDVSISKDLLRFNASADNHLLKLAPLTHPKAHDQDFGLISAPLITDKHLLIFNTLKEGSTWHYSSFSLITEKEKSKVHIYPNSLIITIDPKDISNKCLDKAKVLCVSFIEDENYAYLTFKNQALFSANLKKEMVTHLQMQKVLIDSMNTPCCN